MKKLPIGIQTFEKIIEEDYLYVDKTKYLYNVITSGNTYFLSRPRRFGKSLTLSTLEAIFKGRKELFKGLWIENSDYNWESYPVIRVDMSEKDSADLINVLKREFFSLCEREGIYINIDCSLQEVFKNLIIGLREKYDKKVVVLIDEYDKPILNVINDIEASNKNRDILKDFYGVIKSQDENVKFVLLTGVTKFSKVSIFSGLNNLNDITMDIKYSGMLGYTQKELEESFKEYIKDFCEEKGKKKDELLKEIKKWYNGFCFAGNGEKVYNPFSTLLLFNKKDFRNYWFETATPTFLVNLIREKDFNIFETEINKATEENFSVFEIEQLNVLALLVQTGYFTIKRYDEERGLYNLGYPNKEVELAFTRNLIFALRNEEKSNVDSELNLLLDNLYDGKIDEFFERFKSFVASVPYTIRLKREEEKYYQIIFFTVLRCLGINVNVEMTTNTGRIDATIELQKIVYIVEFKINETKEQALAQIKEKKYYEKFLNTQKEIYLVGCEVDKQEKNLALPVVWEKM